MIPTIPPSLPRVASPLAHALTLASRSGLWLEFGVFRGTTLRQLAAARGNARVVGFDSFRGLPSDWREGHPAGEFAIDEPPVVDGAEIAVGLFEDTLPRFAFDAPVTLVHVDCDLYASAACALEHVQTHLAPGAVLVFDELLGYPGYEAHEWRALAEAVERGLRIEWVCVSECGEKAAVRVVGQDGSR
jgi:hypothetical protein